MSYKGQPKQTVTGLADERLNTSEETDKMSKGRIIKNVIVVSVAFLCLFTAFSSTSNLQSSLNRSEGLGTAGLATVYAALVLSCLFTPSFVINLVGCKWTVALSMLCYVPYMVAHFHPVWGTMIPGAVILGVGAAPLWSAKCTYLTQIGCRYAELTGTTRDGVINQFFGIFFMMFQTSHIWGNLTSSLVFREPDLNSTVVGTSRSSCGASDCPAKTDSINGTNLQTPGTDKMHTLFGIYIACALVGFAVVALFLDPIQADNDDSNEKRPKLSLHLVLEPLGHLWGNHYQKLLVTMSIYSGMEQAFITGDFTRSYITCSMGVANVGYIMICYGVVNAVCSFTFGRLVRYVGHMPFFLLVLVVHLGCQIFLLYWTPDPDRLFIFYFLTASWGLGDAVIQTQLNALYGYLFSTNPGAAFANHRLWESVGFVCAFGYSFRLCADVKLYICMTVLVAGITQYGIVEYLHRRRPLE